MSSLDKYGWEGERMLMLMMYSVLYDGLPMRRAVQDQGDVCSARLG
jgi:hypothetical protein